ncbi:hypothetical protein QUF80_16020 [Desulfococcaceae bacterium HSG8]|nr:hypothetical protein [Desulfococcaceae bacterium HSG8]
MLSFRNNEQVVQNFPTMDTPFVVPPLGGITPPKGGTTNCLGYILFRK